MYTIFHPAVLVILALAALRLPQAVPEPPVPRYEQAECPFPVPDTVTCGYLVVAENRTSSAAPRRTLRLAVVILKSWHPDPAPDPVVFLEGGPGASAIEMISGWFRSPIRERRDIILFEQRGTRFSEPWLSCPELTEVQIQNFQQVLSDEQEIALEAAAGSRCRDRLRTAGADLAAYNSAASAEDLHELRQQLGYVRWNLYGISYGTRLALGALRADPQGIRSVVLDSVYPPDYDSYASRLPNAARAFQVLFQGCAADPACSRAYPQLEEHFYALLQKTNNHPLELRVRHPSSGEMLPVTLTGGDLAGMVFLSLYDPAAIPFQPYLIERLYQGNTKVVLPTLEQGLKFLSYPQANGMYYSVECNERAGMSALEAIAKAAEAYPLLKNYYPFRSDLEICATWGAGTANPAEYLPVESKTPVLLLAGQFDPITPPESADHAAQSLANSYVFKFPGQGHAVSGSSCGMQVATEFLEDPGRAPAAECLQAMPAVHFIVPPQDLFETTGVYNLYSKLLVQRDPLQLGLLVFCLVFFLAEVLLWLVTTINSLVRRPVAAASRGQGLARLGLFLAAVSNLVFLVGLVYWIRQVLAANWMMLAFGLPAAARGWFILPALSAILTPCLLGCAFLAWRRGWFTLVGRLHYTLVTAAAVIFCGLLAYWGLLGM